MRLEDASLAAAFSVGGRIAHGVGRPAGVFHSWVGVAGDRPRKAPLFAEARFGVSHFAQVSSCARDIVIAFNLHEKTLRTHRNRRRSLTDLLMKDQRLFAPPRR